MPRARSKSASSHKKAGLLLQPPTTGGGETSIELRSLALPSMFWRPDYVAAETPAWVGHFPFAFWVMEAHRPRTVVELGTHYGNSYFAFCQAAERLHLDSCCYAIDTWKGDQHAGLYGEEVFAQVSAHNDLHFSGFSTLIRSTFDDALPHFDEGSVDLLHIDGHHSYDSVRHDFEAWLPKLSPRSVVLFHDTNVRFGDFGVGRYFRDLAQVYPHFEFHHSHGLGVLAVGAQQSSLIRQLVSPGSPQSSSINHIFSRLGHNCVELARLKKTQHEVHELSGQLLAHGKLEEKLRRDTEALCAERDALAARLSALQVEKEQLSSHAQDLGKSLSESQNRETALVNEHETFASFRHQADEELQRLQSSLSKATRELATVTAAFSQQSDQANTALQEHLAHEEERQRLIAEVRTREQDRELLRSELDELRSQLEKTNAEFIAATSSLSEHDELVNALRKELSEARTDHDKDRESLVDTLTALQKEHEQLQSETASLRGKSDKANLELATIAQKFAQQHEQLSALEAAKTSHEEERLRLIAEIRTREQDRTLLRSELDELRSQLEKTNTELRSIAKAKEAAFNETQELRSKLRRSHEELSSLSCNLVRQQRESAAKQLRIHETLIPKTNRKAGFFRRINGSAQTSNETTLAQIIGDSGLFDADYYLRNYPEVRDLGVDPILHYLTFGYRELKNPSPDFDTARYIALNPDILLSQSAINPLVHYIQHGRSEGRPT